MIIKIRIAHWRFTWTFAPVTDVTGVNSTLPDGSHITMWDFDDVPLQDIVNTLTTVQYFHKLPNIYVLNTGLVNHYIAYCFKSMPWKRSILIVAETDFVDPNFFKYGVYREHWTLRVTPKEGRKPKLVDIIHSFRPEDCSIDELNSWVKDMKGTQCIAPLRTLRLPSQVNTALSYPPKIRDARRCYTYEEVGAKCHQ